MALELKIEDSSLRKDIYIAKDEYKPLFDMHAKSIVRKFGARSEEAIEAAEALKKAALMFAGTYKSTKSRIEEENLFNGTTPENFKRAYFVYVASEAAIQYITNSSDSIEKKFNFSRPIAGFDMELKVRDYNTIADVLEHLNSYISETKRADEVSRETATYFKYVNMQALNILHASYMEKQKDKVKDLTVKGKYFEIKGLVESRKKKKGRRKKEQEETPHQNAEGDLSFNKDPTIIELEERVEKKDIVGNKEAVDAVENLVHDLLAYDRKKKMNPYMIDGGFNQLILLAGDSGTGKTYTVNYGISEAERIAEENGLEFQAVQLEFEDAYQNGPVKILRYQLRKIAESNIPQLVFVDEMEGKFPKRNGIKTERHEEKVVRELLDFTNGLSYINKGNWAFIGATNLLDMIDKAVRSRFNKGTYLCEGPTNAQERARILYNRLKKGIDQGYIKIVEWREIGEVAHTLELGGRDLKNTALDLIEKSRIKERPNNFFKLTYAEKLELIRSQHCIIKDEDVIKALYETRDKRGIVKKATAAFGNE